MRIIAGEWGGRRLQALKGRGIRPTTDRVRESWMAALGGSVVDARVLDLFAGSGALGLEALSRGAREATFVELSRAAIRTLRANADALKAEDRCRIVKADAMAFLRASAPGAFDLVLADPPYDKGYAAKLLQWFSEEPFAGALWVEHRSKEIIPGFPGLRQRRYGDTTLSILTRGE